MMTRGLAAVALLSYLYPIAAEAGAVTPRQMREGKVTACSSYDSRCYTAGLVRSPVGWQLRLQSGTLIDCGVTCDDTLRRATVDFWEDQRERSR